MASRRCALGFLLTGFYWARAELGRLLDDEARLRTPGSKRQCRRICRPRCSRRGFLAVDDKVAARSTDGQAGLAHPRDLAREKQVWITDVRRSSAAAGSSRLTRDPRITAGAGQRGDWGSLALFPRARIATSERGHGDGNRRGPRLGDALAKELPCTKDVPLFGTPRACAMARFGAAWIVSSRRRLARSRRCGGGGRGHRFQHRPSAGAAIGGAFRGVSTR